MLSNDEIIERLQNAFKPLRCAAEIWDYEQKVRLRVFDDDDNAAITFPSESLSRLRDESALESLIDAALVRLHAAGHNLDPI